MQTLELSTTRALNVRKTFRISQNTEKYDYIIMTCRVQTHKMRMYNITKRIVYYQLRHKHTVRHRLTPQLRPETKKTKCGVLLFGCKNTTFKREEN